MTRDRTIATVLALGLCVGGILWSVAWWAFRGEDPVWRGPAGIKDTPVRRLASRMVTDQADDAFHGGARHNVKFAPRTEIGRAMLKIAESRGVDKMGKRAAGVDDEKYLKATKAWLRWAFLADPSNYNAFSAYHLFLTEPPREAESGGGAEQDFPVWPSGKPPFEPDFAAAQEAVDIFLANQRLSNAEECYNAAVVWWIDYMGKNQGELEETGRKIRTLIVLGDHLGVRGGNPEDAQAARQFVAALERQIRNALKAEEKKPIAKDGDILYH